MVSVTPIAALVFPILVVGSLRERWAFFLFLVSIPFFTPTVVIALSHSFNLPEIMMILLLGHHSVGWIRSGTIHIENALPVVMLWLFLAVGTVSVVLAIIRPTEVLVHPYEATFISQTFVPLVVTSEHVTQLLLRVFSVGAVTVLVLAFQRGERIEKGIRAVAYAGVLAGLVGLAHQVAVILDVRVFTTVARATGFGVFPISPGQFGPIPRMYSIAGEPGYTANLLLYTLALVLTFATLATDRTVFSNRESLGLTMFLGVVLLLSTSTTGYGGLLILVSVLGVLLVLLPNLRSPHLSHYLMLSAAALGTIGLVLVIATAGQAIDLIAYQTRKMMFQAGSGSIRLMYIRRSLTVFYDRALFGAGVGSHSAPSFFATMLAETGILGMVTLIGAFLVALRRSFGLAVRGGRSGGSIAAAATVAGGTLLLTNLIAKSISSLLMPWYWIALALPIAVVARPSIRAITEKTGTSGASTLLIATPGREDDG